MLLQWQYTSFRATETICERNVLTYTYIRTVTYSTQVYKYNIISLHLLENALHGLWSVRQVMRKDSVATILKGHFNSLVLGQSESRAQTPVYDCGSTPNRGLSVFLGVHLCIIS